MDSCSLYAELDEVAVVVYDAVLSRLNRDKEVLENVEATLSRTELTRLLPVLLPRLGERERLDSIDIAPLPPLLKLLLFVIDARIGLVPPGTIPL
jgi:hypothetical protein